nr:hypothetical protein [Halomonas socia]
MKAYLALFALLIALPAHADWQLDPKRSQVEATIFELTDSGPVEHQHRVRELRGDISEDGILTLPLRLNQTDALDRLGPLPPWLSGITDMPLATLNTQLPPERLDALDIGESMVETLTFSVRADGNLQQEPVDLRFTREDLNTVRVTTAEPVALDGQEIMANSTLRSVLSLLGYQRIGNEVPVVLDATLIQH